MKCYIPSTIPDDADFEFEETSQVVIECVAWIEVGVRIGVGVGVGVRGGDGARGEF